jgi:26S proteasome regulatory subunit N3
VVSAADAVASAAVDSGKGGMDVEEVPSASSSSSSAAPGPAGGAGAAAAAPAAPPAALRLPKASAACAPEIEAYLALLALTQLAQRVPAAAAGSSSAATAAAPPAAGGARWAPPALLGEGACRLLEQCAAAGRRTLDFFQARAHALLALAHEAAGSLAALRPQLMQAHRTACLRLDEFGQAVLLNLLLRSYLGGAGGGAAAGGVGAGGAGAGTGAEVEVEAAQSLVSKAAFPESASNSQLVRFLLYSGRVHAVQLRYSDAYRALLQAVRKAPAAAVGFRAQAHKFAAVVQLLMGDIPERATFAAPELRRALAPYLALARAVRGGDVRAFAAVLALHGAAFAADGTATLVRRLEANVIKAGLRRIATSYSRISFAAVALKLSRGSAEDAEVLCAQAVRDGVIDAVLDHEAGVLESRAQPNVYGGKEPQEAFRRRIGFCLQVHDEAVRALRFPPSAGAAGDLESAEARAKREKEEAELLEEIENGDGDDDEDLDGGGDD